MTDAPHNPKWVIVQRVEIPVTITPGEKEMQYHVDQAKYPEGLPAFHPNDVYCTVCDEDFASHK